MAVSRFGMVWAVAAVACLVITFWVGRFSGIEGRWGRLKEGMTETEVRQVLGVPDWTGNVNVVGARDKPVIRWIYRGRRIFGSTEYCVDFDHTGLAGSPVVYRTERVQVRWRFPWQPAIKG